MKQDYNVSQLSVFAGPWTAIDPTQVPPTGALAALNTCWIINAPKTRFGFTPVWNPAETIRAMFNWQSSRGNWLVYYSTASGGTLKLVKDLTAPSPITLYTQASAGAVIASPGPSVYVATYDTNGLGVGDGHVICFIIGDTSAKADRLFLGPMTVAPTIINTGVGVVTAGLHRIGYIVQTRAGFVGKISPTDGNGTYLTTTTITANGGQQIQESITATWPAEATAVFPVMSPVSNPARYFIVPGQSAVVVGGALSTVIFNINISDDDLLAAAVTNEVTGNQNLFTQTPGGTAPFSPFSLGTYGQRNWYLTEINNQSQAYMSDPQNPQQITADQHVLYLSGFRQMKAAFSMGGVWYCLGPHWTYGFRDNGDVPVTWALPDLVDGAIGAYGPLGTSVNQAQGFAFVAHQTGLWVFSGGSYATRPLTYYRDDLWQQINWTGAGVKVQVIDHKDKQTCYILAPLGTATENTNIITIDYKNGLTAEAVKISEWDLANAGYTGVPSAAIVQNPTSSEIELWISTSGTGGQKVLRQMNPADTNPFADDTLGIDWQFETALLPGINGTVFYHYALQARLLGAGTVYGTTYGVDRTKSSTWTLPITNPPGQMYIKRYPRLRSESASIRFTNNKTANAWAQLAGLDHYFAPGPAYR